MCPHALRTAASKNSQQVNTATSMEIPSIWISFSKPLHPRIEGSP
jgi:hypothetical protein